MEVMLAIAIGALYATALYLILRRSIVKLIIGLALLGHAANLLIFTSARLVRGRPALIEAGETALEQPHADPLPQALILTAIVISFAIVAFTLVLVNRTYEEVGTDDLDRLNTTDK